MAARRLLSRPVVGAATLAGQQIGAAADVGGASRRKAKLLRDVDQLGEPLQGGSPAARSPGSASGCPRRAAQHDGRQVESATARAWERVLLQVGPTREKARPPPSPEHLPLNLEDGGQAGPRRRSFRRPRQDLGDPLRWAGTAGSFSNSRRGRLHRWGPPRRSLRANRAPADVVQPAGPQVGGRELQFRHLGRMRSHRVPAALRIGPSLPRRVEPFERAVGA